MKNPILKLILNPQGTISKKQYLIGLVLLFNIISFSQLQMGLEVIFSVLLSMGAGNIEDITYIYQMKVLLSYYIPTLIPIYFLLFFSGLVITLKRCRALGKGLSFSIISIVINFFFFVSISGAVQIFAYARPAVNGRITVEITILIILASLIILGLLLNTYLIFSSERNQNPTITPNFISNSSFDQYRYTLFIGKMMLVNFTIACILFGTFYSAIAMGYSIFNMRVGLNWFNSSEFVYVLLGMSVIWLLSNLFYYFRASVKRLQDAQINLAYMVWALIILFVVFGVLSYFASQENSSNEILMIFFSFKILSVLLIACQVALFLLPSKDLMKEKHEPKPKSKEIKNALQN